MSGQQRNKSRTESTFPNFNVHVLSISFNLDRYSETVGIVSRKVSICFSKIRSRRWSCPRSIARGVVGLEYFRVHSTLDSLGNPSTLFVGSRFRNRCRTRVYSRGVIRTSLYGENFKSEISHARTHLDARDKRFARNETSRVEPRLRVLELISKGHIDTHTSRLLLLWSVNRFSCYSWVS